MKWMIPGSRRARALWTGAVVTTAALVGGGLTVANSADAAQTATTGTTYRAQLIEMRTAGSVGYFYTANQAEYLRAQKLAFKFTGQVPGYVSSRAIRGTVPLYRLRWLTRSSYLLTISRAERNKLAASGQFVYEGVVGRVPMYRASDRVLVYRVSKNNQWRLVRAANIQAQLNAGWHLDGPLAYLWTHK